MRSVNSIAHFLKKRYPLKMQVSDSTSRESFRNIFAQSWSMRSFSIPCHVVLSFFPGLRAREHSKHFPCKESQQDSISWNRMFQKRTLPTLFRNKILLIVEPTQHRCCWPCANPHTAVKKSQAISKTKALTCMQHLLLQGCKACTRTHTD